MDLKGGLMAPMHAFLNGILVQAKKNASIRGICTKIPAKYNLMNAGQNVGR
jgi:hypothetical protein